MATNYTANLRLQKPSAADRLWDAPLNANADAIDGLAAVGGLAVTPAESPSTSLACRVTPGTYLRADGSIASFSGSTSITLPASATTCVWLTDAGVPTLGATYPSTPHLRLAQVQAGATTIAGVIDARVAYRSAGSNAVFVAKTGDSIAGPLSVIASAGSAVLAVDPTAMTVGFFGATPTSQASKLTPLVDATGGIASDTIANVGASFSQGTLNNNFAAIVAKVDALILAIKRHGLMAS